MKSAIRSTLLVCITVVFGCTSNSESFPTVTLDGTEVATKIMEKFDQDGDGQLSATEVKGNGGLTMMLEADKFHPEVLLDADSNGSVSQQELADKLNGCFAHKRGSLTCSVKYKNRPLPGATVKLIPEDFMGDIGSAQGETDEEGNCGFTNEDGFMGAKPGIYRVEITHPEAKISSRYNTESVLSIAVDTTNPYAKSPEFRVK